MPALPASCAEFVLEPRYPGGYWGRWDEQSPGDAAQRNGRIGGAGLFPDPRSDVMYPPEISELNAFDDATKTGHIPHPFLTFFAH